MIIALMNKIYQQFWGQLKYGTWNEFREKSTKVRIFFTESEGKLRNSLRNG